MKSSKRFLLKNEKSVELSSVLPFFMDRYML